MTAIALFSWFQRHYPEVIQQWSNCSHHYSLEDQNIYHLEGSLLAHMAQVMLVADILKLDPVSSAAALFHDLGKPATRKENHEKKRVSMIAHEPLSAFMAIDFMESLSLKQKLSSEDKVNIFIAICYHVDFHKIIEQCYHNQSFDLFINRYRGFSQMAEILVNLGIADSLGRFSDPVLSPRDQRLWTLMREMKEKSIFNQMIKVKNENEEKPVVEFLIGLPCSGKSNYRNKTEYTQICRDDIILELGNGKCYNDSFSTVDSGVVNSILDTKIKQAIRAKASVVFDLTNLIKSRRVSTLNQFKDYYKKAVVFLEPLAIINQRNLERQKSESKYISEEVYFQMMTSFTPPSFDEFDEILYYYRGELVNIK